MLNVQPIFPFHKYKIPNKEEMDFEIVSGKEGKVRLERFQVKPIQIMDEQVLSLNVFLIM